jgi:hypothetical protein
MTVELKRPYPPAELVEAVGVDAFWPAPDVATWAMDAFVFEGSPTTNPDHAHLMMASIGFLWTNAACDRKMRDVVGMAELTKPKPMENKWEKARKAVQLRDWFTEIPDFLITLYAPYAHECDHYSFCALVEHELYHCALKTITSKGMPIWGILGHDVEEFVGVTARYGTGASAGKTRDLVNAANRKPLIGAAEIAGVCGTCLRLAA